MDLTPKEQQAKKRVCFALDVPTVKNAIGLAEELSDYVGMCKINSLYQVAVNEGVNIIKEISEKEGAVFLDLKFHDTPETVYNYAKAVSIPGVSFFNIHIGEGGEDMCRKAVQGAYEGAQARKIKRPKVIGVTVLTSIGNKDLREEGIKTEYDDLVKRRTYLARKWGLDGVVCPASKAGGLEKEFGSDFMYVTPGIEWKGVKNLGQKQLYTPDRAVQDCSNSILVIGSAIAKAGDIYEEKDKKKILVQRGTPDDRRRTAYEILQAMAKFL